MGLTETLIRAVGTNSSLGALQFARETVDWVIRRHRGSYAQHGEDVMLLGLFHGIVGTYIDIGANHPFILNNTYMLYRRGWRGVNVEPHPRMHKRLRSLRPGDQNLLAGAGNEDGELDFYRLWPASRSTFSKKVADALVESGKARLLGVDHVPVMTLSSIAERLGKQTSPHILSVDTEGFELEILSGVQWDTFRPGVVIVEVDCDNGVSRGPDLDEFLLQRDYLSLRHLGCNQVYVRAEGLAAL